MPYKETQRTNELLMSSHLKKQSFGVGITFLWGIHGAPPRHKTVEILVWSFIFFVPAILNTVELCTCVFKILETHSFNCSSYSNLYTLFLSSHQYFIVNDQRKQEERKGKERFSRFSPSSWEDESIILLWLGLCPVSLDSHWTRDKFHQQMSWYCCEQGSLDDSTYYSVAHTAL